MSDPKQPVDPLAQTHASLPQQQAPSQSHAPSQQPYAGAQPNVPSLPQQQAPSQPHAQSLPQQHVPYAGAQPNAPSYAEQLAAHQAAQAPAPQHVPRRSATPWIVAAIVVTAGAAGIAFAITKLSSHEPKAGSGSARVIGTGSSDGSGINPLLGSAHGSGSAGSNGSAASATGVVTDLLAQRGRALDPGVVSVFKGMELADDVVTIGVDANELGSGIDAAVTIIAHDFAGATDVGATRTSMMIVNGSTYSTQTLRATVAGLPRTFAMTEVRGQANGRGVVRAWHLSRIVPDQVAYDAMRAGTLPQPQRVDSVHDADPALETTVRQALGSHDAYVALMSTSTSAFSFGSAGEELDGPKAKAGFRAMRAQFALHDGLHIARVTDTYAFAVANVDFTNRFGTETFRVLVGLVKENGQWRILLGHWSNGFPIPGAP